jgi:hypothetical protein
MALTTFYYSSSSPTTSADTIITSSSRLFGSTSILTRVVIGDTVTSIADNAFDTCINLVSVTFILPSVFTTIGYQAFADCFALKEFATPESVTSIGDQSFGGTVIDSFYIPAGVTSISAGVFNGGKIGGFIVSNDNPNYSHGSLGELFNKNKTTLVKYASKRIDSSYTIPDSVTTLESVALGYSDNLRSITITNNITSIPIYCFADCQNLTEIYIGKRVNSIADTGFGYCANLSKIFFAGNAPSFAGNIFLNTNANLKIYRYSTKSGWSSTFSGKDVLLIDSSTHKGLQTFGLSGIVSGKISIPKIYKINYLGNFAIPTLMSSAGNSENYVFSTTDDIYFEAEVYLNSYSADGNPILEATSTTYGIVNEFSFQVIGDNGAGRSLPTGSFGIYNGVRGSSLSIHYTNIAIINLNTWTKVTAKRINGVWSLFIDDIQRSVSRFNDYGVPNDQFGNKNLPVYIGRSNIGNFNFDGQIRNVILSNKKQNLGYGGGKITTISSFSPKDLIDMQLWLKSDVGVTLAGSNVTAWADQSGNSRNFIKSIANTGFPTFSNEAVLFTSSARYGASNASILALPSNSLNFTTPYTLITLLRSGSNSVVFSKSNDDNKRRKYQISINNGIIYSLESRGIYIDTSISYNTGTGNDSSIKRLIVAQYSSNTSGLIRYNGAQVATGFTDVGIDQTNTASIFIGASPFSEGSGYNAEASDGMYVYEILFYNRALSTVEIEKIETYLNQKYSVY